MTTPLFFSIHHQLWVGFMMMSLFFFIYHQLWLSFMMVLIFFSIYHQLCFDFMMMLLFFFIYQQLCLGFMTMLLFFLYINNFVLDLWWCYYSSIYITNSALTLWWCYHSSTYITNSARLYDDAIILLYISVTHISAPCHSSVGNRSTCCFWTGTILYSIKYILNLSNIGEILIVHLSIECLKFKMWDLSFSNSNISAPKYYKYIILSFQLDTITNYNW